MKKDVFGEISLTETGSGAVILRDAVAARRWARPLARHLLRREGRALRKLTGIAGVPELIDSDGVRLLRSYLDGVAMQRAGPTEPEYYRSAKRLLRAIHRRGVVHNDLAKEANWLVRANGEPALVDFQLALVLPRQSRRYRILAYEDLRHLLKHKRSYCAQYLTARELGILDRPSFVSRAWMATGKKAYLFITRRLLGWRDREGASDRGEIN